MMFSHPNGTLRPPLVTYLAHVDSSAQASHGPTTTLRTICKLRWYLPRSTLIGS